MKKYLFLLAASLTVLGACNKLETAKSVKVELQFNTPSSSSVPAPSSYAVKFMNEEGVCIFDEAVNVTNGSAFVEDIVPGIYNISVYAESTNEGKPYSFIGNSNSCAITSNNQKINIEVAICEASPLVIKELYYSLGANCESNNNYRDDNFWEIYNNSPVDQVLDGLCIADLAPTTISQSIYNWPLDKTKYVFCLNIWQFPGTGADYVLKPGESAVVAAVAIDHTQITTKTVDLSKADFETFIDNGQVLLPDNPKVPNMKLLFGSFGTGRERYNIGAMGPAVVLFKPQGAIDNSTSVSAEGKTELAKEIPVEWVIDGIEAVQTEKEIPYKRMPESIDAGATHVNYTETVLELAPGYNYIMVQSTHNGESVYRKVNGEAGGITIYQDTNNSTNDFEIGTPAVVRRGGAGVPSWSPAK